ncbi:unnamed protein product [Ixodes persulcatus]
MLSKNTHSPGFHLRTIIQFMKQAWQMTKQIMLTTQTVVYMWTLKSRLPCTLPKYRILLGSRHSSETPRTESADPSCGHSWCMLAEELERFPRVIE